LHQYQRSGIPIDLALRAMMRDPEAGGYRRGTAAKLLALADARASVGILLDLFFAQTDKIELWETALAIEHLADCAAVPRLVDALYDANPDRRHAAARALGWIWPVGRRAAKALIQALLDKSQPQPVREEAAESLAYSRSAEAVPPLISVLNEPDVRMRFWAVFALGGIGQWQTFAPADAGKWRERGGADLRVIEALERMLPDNEVQPGNWWSVGREALAMLGKLEPRYRAKLDHETERVLDDPNPSPEDLRWAQAYSRQRPTVQL
jgi:HEAT repeat protein